MVENIKSLSFIGDEYFPQSSWKIAIEVLSLYVQIPICVIGCILNMVNFAIFVQQDFSSATYVLITALSLTDSFTLFLRVGQGLIRCSSEGWCNNPYFRFFLYIFIVFLDIPITNTTESISSWLTMALAIERCLTMRWYHLSKVYCTIKNARNLIIAISFFATILNLPFFFTLSLNISLNQSWSNASSSNVMVPVITSQWTSFAENSTYYLIHSWTRTVLVQYVPFIFLCVSNVLLFTFLRTHNRRFVRASIKKHHSELLAANKCKGILSDSYKSYKLSNSASQLAVRKQKAQKKLTILLIIVILLFLLFQIPHGFAYVKIYQTIGSCPSYNKIDECTEYQMYRTITMILTLLGYSANFFVYFVLNLHFRASFFRMFRSKDSDDNTITGDHTEQLLDSKEFQKMTKLYLFPFGQLTYGIAQPRKVKEKPNTSNSEPIQGNKEEVHSFSIRETNL